MCSSPPFLVTLSSSWSSIRASPQRHKALKRPQSIQAPDPQARNPFLLAADLLKPLSQSAHQAWCHPIGIQDQSSPQGPADSKRSTDDCAAFYINTDTRIQILDSMDHLPQAEKEQCDAFLLSPKSPEALSEPPRLPQDEVDRSTTDDTARVTAPEDYSPETPSEPPRTLSQAEVDRDMKMMTCGVMVEEHFWPLRYKIRRGKLQAYENTIRELVYHAHEKEQWTALSELTAELISYRVRSDPSLTSFLSQNRGVRERLSKIASGMGIIKDTQLLKDAMWSDNLMT
ncbi:hypothetical protein C8J57DRAFT_1477222, partial [Mycena rebaudengoi]